MPERIIASMCVCCPHRSSSPEWWSQELALSVHECLSVLNRCGIHAVCAAFLGMLSQLGPPPSLQQHVTLVRTPPSEHKPGLARIRSTETPLVCLFVCVFLF